MIAIIDYKAGNLKSVERALNRLGFPCGITHDKKEILSSERIVFPGVGAAGKAIDDLRHLGLDLVLRQAIEAGKPVLGICLGAQIILDKSEENNTPCLGLIRGEVKLFPSPLVSAEGERLKIPHMGWNGLNVIRRHPVLEGVMPSDEFYFVHSYYPMPASDQFVIGTTEYGIGIPSVIGNRNLIATQFHLEKSGVPGLRILKNFCDWDGQTC
jgi:imidazole glycerol-phosphate synthase subunit HisH